MSFPPRPPKTVYIIKDVPAVDSEEAKLPLSRQRVPCPEKNCMWTARREKLEKHLITKHNATAVVAKPPTNASQRVMEEAAFGEETASELAAARKRPRPPNGTLYFINNFEYFLTRCLVCFRVVYIFVSISQVMSSSLGPLLPNPRRRQRCV